MLLGTKHTGRTATAAAANLVATAKRDVIQLLLPYTAAVAAAKG